MAIGEKIFEEKITPVGFAIKSVGSEGVESEYSITGEITGFGKAQGVKGTNMGLCAISCGPAALQPAPRKGS